MTRQRPARLGALAALAGLLAGCGGAGEGLRPFGDFAEVAADSLSIGAPATPAPLEMPQGAIPAAVVAGTDRPAIALTLAGAQRIVLSAAPDAGETYLNFQDQNRRGLRLRGGAVAGTYGFGEDLLAVRHHEGDPVAHPTPLAQWPGQVDREYQYRLRDLGNYSITVSCVFERVARETIEVIARHETVRIVETCTNHRRSFENTYWVEPGTGIIRRSRQWTGPSIPAIAIEIVKPAS